MRFILLLLMFSFSITTNARLIDDDTLQVGEGADSDIKLEIELGKGASNPYQIYNTTLDKFQVCNEGAACFSVEPDTDTNAGTECDPGEYLDGDGSCYAIPSGGGASTLQDAYDNSTDGEIVLDGTRTSLEVRDAATPIGAILFEILSNDSLTSYFSVDSSKAIVGGDLEVNSTGYVRPAVGDDSERPGTPTIFDFRGNTDQSCIEYYDGANWTCIGTGIPLLAKGSLITSDGVNNGEFSACANGETIEWDSAQANGFKCVPIYSSPTTTQGDIIVRGVSGDQNLPIGANNTYLKSNGTTLVYDTVSATPSFNVVTKTSSGSLALSGEEKVICDSTSGAVTLSLPTAIGNDGLTYTIKSLVNTNYCLIDPNGAETLDGESTTRLSSAGDSITITSDGSNWISSHRKITVKFFASTNNGQTCTTNISERIEYEDESYDSHDFYSTASGAFTPTGIYSTKIYLCCASIATTSVEAEAGDRGELYFARTAGLHRRIDSFELSDANGVAEADMSGCAFVEPNGSYIDVRGFFDDSPTNCTASSNENYFTCVSVE